MSPVSVVLRPTTLTPMIDMKISFTLGFNSTLMRLIAPLLPPFADYSHFMVIF
jgi:hypothetical protein